MVNSVYIPTRIPLAACIFRGEPPHMMHLHVVLEALKVAERVVIVLGSSWRSRNPKNPFVFRERAEMILRMLTLEQCDRVTFVGVRDVYDDARWVAMVRAKVEAFATPGLPVALVGFEKDATSYYLQRFPAWQFIDAGSHMAVNSTELRAMLFGGTAIGHALTAMKASTHPAVLAYLAEWARTAEYARRCAEHQANEGYRVKYPEERYYTGDAIIEAAGHFLMIERDGALGKDTHAWTGGHQEGDESGLDIALRENGKEVTAPWTVDDLRSALVAQHVFDAPGRSPRGRIITTACHFKLPGYTKETLPVMYGRDDAKPKRANWFTRQEFADIMHDCFDDHDVIGEHFMGPLTPTVEGIEEQLVASAAWRRAIG